MVIENRIFNSFISISHHKNYLNPFNVNRQPDPRKIIDEDGFIVVAEKKMRIRAEWIKG